MAGREKNEGNVFASICILGSSGCFSAFEESHIMASGFGPSSPLPLTHWSFWGVGLGLCGSVVARASLRRWHEVRWYQGLTTPVLGEAIRRDVLQQEPSSGKMLEYRGVASIPLAFASVYFCSLKHLDKIPLRSSLESGWVYFYFLILMSLYGSFIFLLV